MNYNKQDKNFQDKLAEYIVKKGYTLYGGYVYKKLVNGDETKDIDVHVENKNDMNLLAENLKDMFDCKEEKLYIDGRFLDFGSYVTGMRISCPCPHNVNNAYLIDLMIQSLHQNNDILKLEYKQINEKPQFCFKNGSDEQANKVIKQLKQRQFTPWANMRTKDIQYFSKDKWKNTDTYGFKIKKVFGFIE